MEKGPFSLYDFMGYFIPGALALYLFVLFQSDIQYYFNKDFFYEKNKVFLELPIYIVLFYVIISYCLGHFLSFFSALTIEKYTRIIYDDPSKLLLANDDFQQRSLFKFKKDSFRNFRFKKKCFKNFSVLRFILFLLIWPLIIYDIFMVRMLKFNHTYLKRIDEPYNLLVKKRISEVFAEIGYKGNLFEDSKNNFHQLLIHYNYEFTKYHGHKLMNYVSLYGFLRVITLISCLFLNCIVIKYMYAHPFLFNFDGLKNFFLFLVCLFSICSMTYVFYLGYLKFYRRYTLENLMLVLIIDKKN